MALLYQRGSFKVLQHQSIRIPHKQLKKGATRDILHVVGEVLSGNQLDVFVCHFPSRSGGQAKSEPYRLLTAKILKEAVDSVMKVRKHPHILIMGDFNDYPTNKSMKKVLCADGGLRNLMKDKKEGTYRYRGEWGILDQFIVSESLLKKKGSIRTSSKKAQIVPHDFLFDKHEKYGG